MPGNVHTSQSFTPRMEERPDNGAVAMRITKFHSSLAGLLDNGDKRRLEVCPARCMPGLISHGRPKVF